ncbi:hypothetical protein BS47DRAFT_1368949 [Hydnum rufescens UP504]|uniref:Uncharacterized protein n=1 Tax=Hydnum rufescens UP504 TaxID=1448309 RepID=A0A9P6AE66_9AGAM|nr:hypothetical protein BS47DRAFT_1368949 [Hydnum rufescens UP504]
MGISKMHLFLPPTWLLSAVYWNSTLQPSHCIILLQNSTLISNAMASPRFMHLCLKTHLRTFPDPTSELAHNLVEGSNGPKPSPEPPPGLLHHPKPNLDSTKLTVVDPLLTRVDTSKGVVTPPKNNEALDLASKDWTRSSPESGHSPDSTASSLMRTAWKPGHLACNDHSDLQLNEPKGVFKGYPWSALPKTLVRAVGQLCLSWMKRPDPQATNPLLLKPPWTRKYFIAEPYCWTNIRKTRCVPEHVAPSRGSGTPWRNALESLEHSRGSRAVEHVQLDFLMNQILQDTAAKVARNYFVSDPDPYKFDPGGVLAVHMEAGVPSEDKVLQLAALGLCQSCTGLKIIAQLQSVDGSESVAYTMNSKAQGYGAGVVNNPPRVISPLAAYSEQEQGLLWWNQEIPTPGTLVSNLGTQLPCPQFDIR